LGRVRVVVVLLHWLVDCFVPLSRIQVSSKNTQKNDRVRFVQTDQSPYEILDGSAYLFLLAPVYRECVNDGAASAGVSSSTAGVEPVAADAMEPKVSAQSTSAIVGSAATTKHCYSCCCTTFVLLLAISLPAFQFYLLSLLLIMRVKDNSTETQMPARIQWIWRLRLYF
jgi:hypothetical protein